MTAGPDQKTAVYIGRFQPLHDAHLHTMLTALDSHARLIILLGSANLARSMKNPWTAPERARMIRAALSEAGIASQRVLIRPLPDQFDTQRWIQDVQQTVHQAVRKDTTTVLVGFDKDSSSSYLRWFPGWQTETSPPLASLQNGSELPQALSATNIRAAYFEGRELRQVPSPVLGFLADFKGTRLFERLRTEHLAVLEQRRNIAALVGTASPEKVVLQETRYLYSRHGAVWLNKRRGTIGRGLWELPQRSPGEHGTLPVQATYLFDHPSRSLVWPTAAHIMLTGGGGEAVPLELALNRPQRFFEDHHIILRRVLRGEGSAF